MTQFNDKQLKKISHILKLNTQKQEAFKKLEKLEETTHEHEQIEALKSTRERIDKIFLEKGEHGHQHGIKCEPCIKEIREDETIESRKKAVMSEAPGCNFCWECIEMPGKVEYYEKNEWAYIVETKK